MNSVQSSLYTAAFTLCLFSAGILGGKKSRLGTPFTYFTIFLVIESVGFVLELLMSHPAAPLKSLWLGLRLGSSLLVAPCLWLAIQQVVEGSRPRISSLGRTQILLIAAGVVLTLPLIENSHWGTTYPNPSRVISAFHSRFIHGTMLLCIAIFACQVPFYLWRCRRRLMQLDQETRVNSRLSIVWLHLPLAVVFTTWILGLLRTIHCASHAPMGLAVLFSFIDVSVTVVAIYMIGRRASSSDYQPSDFVPEMITIAEVIREHPLDTIASPVTPSPLAVGEKENEPSALPLVEPIDDDLAKIQPVQKYRKSSLPRIVRDRIKRKLHQALGEEELYRDSLLNLRSLSAGLKENAHYVSQVINQDLNMSFYQLVNQHRIERAKKLLVDSPDQTVLEIALFVGFNSKSTFNAAFRQNTGVTPRDYRVKQL